MEKMEELRDMLCEELEHIAEKEITTGTLDVIDKLTHSIKSIDTIMAMEESGYSNNSYRSYDDGSYEGYGDYGRRGSYARGRGRNARRDSRGRYSRRYSRAEAKEDMAEKLEDMMGETNDPTVRKALESAIKRMED